MVKNFTGIILYIYYCIVTIFFSDVIISILNTNLPFREFYHPTLIGVSYLYLLPLLIGLYISKITDRSKVRSDVYFLNLSLISGILFYLPFILTKKYTTDYWFDNLAVPYYFLMIFPIIFVIGTITEIHNNSKVNNKIEDTKNNFSKRDYTIGIIIGFIFALINLIPYINAKYLTGADIYYHASMTNEIVNGNSITSSPFFLEGSNYYYSIVYYFLAFIIRFFHTNSEFVWTYFPIFCSFLFFLFFYLFSKKITGKTDLAIISTILVFPIRHLTWSDPSIRNLSYVFFIIFLYVFTTYIEKKKKLYLFFSLILFILTISSHPEIALHIIAIMIVYTLMVKINIFKITGDILHRLNSKTFGTFYISGLDSVNNFINMLFIYLIFFTTSILYLLKTFSVGQILIFNEIALSFFQPIGVISFLVFLIFPIAVVILSKSNTEKNILLLSLSSLFFSIFFYFTYIWIIYHRYIPETAYFGAAIITSIFLKDILNVQSRKKIILLIICFIGISLYPKYVFQTQYIKKINSDLETQIPHIDLVKNNTQRNEVIMINQYNILNRYVPFYAERYVFAGNNQINKEIQWQVLSFCNGPFLNDCNNRNKLSIDFFNDPNKFKLDKIRKMYKIDYLLINKLNFQEINKFQESDLSLTIPVAEDDNYLLYKI